MVVRAFLVVTASDNVFFSSRTFNAFDMSHFCTVDTTKRFDIRLGQIVIFGAAFMMTCVGNWSGCSGRGVVVGAIVRQAVLGVCFPVVLLMLPRYTCASFVERFFTGVADNLLNALFDDVVTLGASLSGRPFVMSDVAVAIEENAG